MKVYYAPKIQLISAPVFYQPEQAVNWVGQSSPAERLVEFAGRGCYQSFHNPAGKTNEDYIKNILEQEHGSVLEHANFSVYIEGISRSLTHELVRHRAGVAFSQLSQRYVDESNCDVVMPPAVMEMDLAMQTQWTIDQETSLVNYRWWVSKLEEKYRADPDTTSRKKRAREAARSMLTNAAETKLVLTGNARAWRHVIELRGSAGADAEIRRLAVALLSALKPASPNLFQDMYIDNNLITAEYSKV